MNPEITAFDVMIRYSLEPEIYSMAVLEAFEKELEGAGMHDYPVHLKIDTGMHRLGFLPEEVASLTERLGKTKNLYIRSVFSHLAASEDPGHDAFTRQQIALFGEVAEKIEQALGYKVLKHILNTAGVERFPEAQFDMVRPGLGIYGISTTLQERLRNVSTFRSVVTQVKRVPAGGSVGYGRSFVADREMSVAVVPVGYADGLKRNLGNGQGFLWTGGRRVPITGKICMDMCMVDVTGMDVKAGDAVEVFGEHIPSPR
jgi:alanine racemase